MGGGETWHRHWHRHQQRWMRVLGLFCLILGLFCLTLGLFCLILGLVCFTLGLFCLILGLFCLIMGLFCQVRVVSLHPPRVLATLSANADDAALIHTSPDSLLPVLSSLLREPAPHSRPLFSALLSLSSLFVSHPSLSSLSPLGESSEGEGEGEGDWVQLWREGDTQ